MEGQDNSTYDQIDGGERLICLFFFASIHGSFRARTLCSVSGAAPEDGCVDISMEGEDNSTYDQIDGDERLI